MKSPNKKWSSLLVLFGVGALLGACQTDSEETEGAAASSDGSAVSTTQPVEPEPEETFTDIRISAVGDIMMHTGQIDDGHNAEDGTYDFMHVFEDVKPIIEEADLAIGNLETTLAGSSYAYSGYPLFNAPDEVIDALKYTGFDALVTANNHSLDTRAEGLRRTVDVIREKGLDPVGTFSSEEDSRVLLKDVEGVEIAIIGYTEHANGLEAQYEMEELDSMINLMSEEQILADIEEAKAMEPDVILATMHWGNEYALEPSEVQTSYAQLMAEAGVDIILGSHPHVIQRSEFIEVDGRKTFVAYSMGNFVSNQRRESLGAGFEPTEDGVIVNLDIQKNDLTGETTLENVEFVPTWVHRTSAETGGYTYRILPVEAALESGEFSEDVTNRLKNSYEETTSRLNPEPVETAESE